MPTVHFKLEPILRRHNKSVLALTKASGLAKTTVYNMVNNKAKAVELETLGKLLDGLERLTGEAITFNDVLEKASSKQNPLLEELLKDAKSFDWEEMRKLIPEWTPEERAENERFMEALEQQRAIDRELSIKRDRELLEIFGYSQEPEESR